MAITNVQLIGFGILFVYSIGFAYFANRSFKKEREEEEKERQERLAKNR